MEYCNDKRTKVKLKGLTPV
ncbi:MAG: hypothetical protein ACLTXO_11775 [Fusobacterium varium]